MTDTAARLTTALEGRYRIERELGGGGMSRVFLATETALGRQVVVKVVKQELLEGLSAARFAREVQLAASLQQANIVPLLAAGEAGGVPYYTMPYVEGESLRQRLSGGAPLTIAECVGIARDVARALGYAHARGVVHRDIKPDNVLLSHGAAMVTDFGIAKAVSASRATGDADTLTQLGTSIGTPAYMSPEQVAGDPDVGPRADLYAWGCLTYELLTGAPPFVRETPQRVMAAHLAEAPAPIAPRRADVPAALERLVMRCLAKDPGERPASADLLLGDLESVTTPGAMAAGGAGVVSAPRAARGRAIAIAAGVVLLLAVAGTAFLRTRRDAGAATLEPKRVAVATFENKSGDPTLDPIGVMAADWIARGLVGTGLVDVGGTAADLAARGVVTRAAPGESPVQVLARDANAGIVISGAFYRQGDSVLFQADFTDANAGKLVQSVGPIAALASAPLDGVERLRQRVIGALAPLVDSTLASYATAIARPPSLEAYRELLAGEAQFYRDEIAAITHYARASAADTNFTLPLLRSLLVFDNMGDEARYDSLATILASRRERLTPFERAYLDYVTCGDSPGRATCVPATAEMVRLTPKSQFARYLNGIVLRWDNRPRAADSVLRALDPTSGELRGRIYFVHHHAGVLHVLGEHARELEVVRGAKAQYPGRLFIAIDEIAALIALGRLDEANRLVDDMFGLQPDQRSSAPWFGAVAMWEMRAHGHPAAADSLGARLLARLDARPAAAARTVAAQRERAEVLVATRRWQELEALADSMVAAGAGPVNALRFRGVALAMQGRRADAEAVSRLLEADQGPVVPADYCSVAWRGCRAIARAYIAAALGEKARAVSLLGYQFFNDRFTHYDLIGELLRDYPPFQDYITPRG